MDKVEELEKQMEESFKKVEDNLGKIKDLEEILEKTKKEEKGE